MPYDVSGNFTRLYNWQADAAATVKILATRMDGEFDNYAEALNQTFLRSGVAPMLGDLSLGGFEIKSLGDGDAVTPALRFATDGSTGMYMPAGGTLAFSAGGTQFLRGINGGATVTGTLAISGAATVGGSLIVGERLVGTSPNSGTTGGVIVRDASGNPNAAYLQFTNFARDAQYGVIRGLSAGGLVFHDATTERARINSVGLGVGRTPTTYPFEVQGSVFIAGGGDLVIASADGSHGNVSLYSDAGDLVVRTDGTVRGRFDELGRLIFGGTATFDPLTNATVQIYGLTEAALALKAVGTTNTIVAFHNDSSADRVGWIGTNGASTVYSETSDRRKKTNIRPAGNSGDIIDSLDVVAYDFIDGVTPSVRFGAIAQDQYTVFPEGVTVGDSHPTEVTRVWGNDPSKAVFLLWRELQLVRKRLAALEA